MHEEQSYPQLDFHLNRYQLDEHGMVANIEDAREIIRNLHKIVQFLQASAFNHLSLNIQSEIALYLVGSYLLTHTSGEQDSEYAEKIAVLEALFNQDVDTMIKETHSTLDVNDVLSSVEELFQNFGKQEE